MKKDSITQKTYFYRESLSNNSYKYMNIFSKFKDYSLKESSRKVKNFIGSVKTSLAKLISNKS